MRFDVENFHLTGRIEAYEGESLAFERDFEETVPSRPSLTKRGLVQPALPITPPNVAFGLAAWFPLRPIFPTQKS